MVGRRGPVRRSGGAALGDKRGVLLVRDRRPPEFEGVELDDALPALVRIPADRIFARRHLDPVEVRARLDRDDAEADVGVARCRVHR